MNKQDAAQQLGDILAGLSGGNEQAITQLLAGVIKDQQKLMVDALLKQSMESMARMQQVIEGERIFTNTVLDRQLALLSVPAARTHATVQRASPLRAVHGSQAQQSSSSAVGAGAQFSEQPDPAHAPRPTTGDDDEVQLIASLDPFEMQTRGGAGFTPGG